MVTMNKQIRHLDLTMCSMVSILYEGSLQEQDIRAIQLLFGQVKLDNIIRYLGAELEDALKISEDTNI